MTSSVVYVPMTSSDYEGYGPPLGVFTNLADAIAWAETQMALKWSPDSVAIFACSLDEGIKYLEEGDSVWHSASQEKAA